MTIDEWKELAKNMEDNVLYHEKKSKLVNQVLSVETRPLGEQQWTEYAFSLLELIKMQDAFDFDFKNIQELLDKLSSFDKENSDLKSQFANAKVTAQEQREIIAREEEGRKELLAICDRKDAEIKALIKANNTLKEDNKEFVTAYNGAERGRKEAIADIKKQELLAVAFKQDHAVMEGYLTRFGIVWTITLMVMFFVSGFGLVLSDNFYVWYSLLGVKIATVFFLVSFLLLGDIANSNFTFGKKGSRRRAFAYYVIVCPISFFFGRVRGHQLRSKNVLWAFDSACVPQIDSKGVISLHRIDLNEWQYDSETNRLMPKKQDHDKPTR